MGAPEPNDATPFLPERPSLKALREAAAGCRSCHLWRPATQTVFGEGRKASRLMLVGEMPGDREDQLGKPFVGPASRELDRGLEAAGIDRRDAYLTNAVKHFKFEEGGRRRLHQTPKRFEARACRPWLDAESTSGFTTSSLGRDGSEHHEALLGSSFRVSELAPVVITTVHPSSILRQPDEESRVREREAFAADLNVVARALSEL